MKIRRLKTVNFRNLPDLDLEINQDLVVLVGGNAAGKTNFLECIYYASSLQAFPPRKSWEMIKWGADYFRLTVELKEKKLEYYYGKQDEKKYQRSQKVNGARKRAGEMFSELPTVVFLPQDLNLLQLGPGPRRSYLDDILLQTERTYAKLLSEFDKVLVQRNELLKRINAGGAGADELDFWDAQLVEHAFNIVVFRRQLIESLNKDLVAVYQNLSGANLDFSLNYRSAFPEEEAGRQKLAELVQSRRSYDVATLQTSVGPHRDDWYLADAEGRNLAHSLSRGEQRSVIISLKIQELLFLEAVLARSPVVLLDELLAELDETRQRHVLKGLPEAAQKFFTTTDLKEVPKTLLQNALVIELKP